MVTCVGCHIKGHRKELRGWGRVEEEYFSIGGVYVGETEYDYKKKIEHLFIGVEMKNRKMKGS